MAMQISSGLLIHENVLIDPFVADLKTVVLFQPTRCLFRAPVLAEQCFDQGPGGDFDAILGFLASVQTKLMCLFGSISFHSTITSQFSADRGFVNIDLTRNFRLVVCCFHKGINLVSLFLGKLCVGSHRCSFDLVVLEAQMLQQLTSYPNFQSCTCELNLRSVRFELAENRQQMYFSELEIS